MTTELIHLGFSNMAAIDKVVAIISPNSAPSKRLIHDAKSKGHVIDMTNGRRTKAVLIMDNGQIVLSAITPETIAGRVASVRKSGPKGQFEEAEQAE